MKVAWGLSHVASVLHYIHVGDIISFFINSTVDLHGQQSFIDYVVHNDIFTFGGGGSGFIPCTNLSQI